MNPTQSIPMTTRHRSLMGLLGSAVRAGEEEEAAVILEIMLREADAAWRLSQQQVLLSKSTRSLELFAPSGL